MKAIVQLFEYVYNYKNGAFMEFYQPIKKPTCSRLSMVTDNGAKVMPKILNGWSNETMFNFSNFYLNYIDGN